MPAPIDAVEEFDPVEVAEALRRRGRVRGEPVAITLFEGPAPEPYAATPVEPCAIVREAMDLGRHAYVDARNHACLAGAWQAGFIDPPEEISSGSYLATHTDFFTPEGARAVKNGPNVLPRGTAAAIGACPLDRVPAGVGIDVVVVVCDPSVAAMVGGVRVALDGTPPTGAAGTSLCGDLFALPWHDPNVVISTGDVGGRMFNRIKPHEMFVIIPRRWAHMIPVVLGSRPDLTGLLDSIKPGYAAEREAKAAARAGSGDSLRWDDEAVALLDSAPDAIREFAAPTMEEYAREHGHDVITVEVISEQMESMGMRLGDVVELAGDAAPAPVPHGATGTETAHAVEPGDVDDLGPARVRSVATAVVEAPAAAVWDLLVDARSWPSWYPDIRDVVVDGGGQLGGGSTLKFTTGPVTVAAEVTRCEPPEVLEFVGRSRGASSTYRFHLREHGGGTLVTLRQATDGLAARTMRPVLQRIADTSLPAWLEAVRRETARPRGG